MWNETLLTASQSDITTEFEAEVWDKDPLWDQLIGKCKYTVTTKELTAGTISTDCELPGRYGTVL